MEPTNTTFSIEMSTRQPQWPDTTTTVETRIRDNVSGELLALYELTADQVLLLQQGGHETVRGRSNAVTPRRANFGKKLEVESVHLGRFFEVGSDRDARMVEAERMAEQLRQDGDWEEVSVRLSNDGYHATLRRWVDPGPDTDTTEESQP